MWTYPSGYALNCRRGEWALDARQTADPVALEEPVQRGSREVRDRRLEGVETIIERQQRVSTKRHDQGFFVGESTVDRGTFGPIGRSSRLARLRHLATVFGLMP